MIRADLHIHTYYSDGTQSPADAVNAARAAGLKLMAVTDHDNMNACAEARTLALPYGITVLDGIEISAYEGYKVHILGYNVNKDCAAYRAFFQRLYDGAEERLEEILAKLKKRGISLSREEVYAQRKSASSPVHVMHVARAGALKGLAVSPSDFYLSYLNMGKCAYSGIGRPTPERAVEVIGECGGVSSLAHPGRIALDKPERLELIDRLKSCGLNGIEAVYSGHTVSDTAYFKEIAERKNLLVTGGSDTHATTGNRRVGDPEFYPSERLLSALKTV